MHLLLTFKQCYDKLTIGVTQNDILFYTPKKEKGVENMKKLISLILLVVVFATMLTACGKFECDICGEEKTGKKYTEELFGEEINICKDCHDDLEDLANAFN